MRHAALVTGVLASAGVVGAAQPSLNQDPDALANNFRDSLLHHEFPLLGTRGVAIPPNPDYQGEGYGIAGAAGFRFAPTEQLGFEPTLDGRERGYCWDKLSAAADKPTFSFYVADGAMFGFEVGGQDAPCPERLGPNSVIATYCARTRTRTWNPTTCPLDADNFRQPHNEALEMDDYDYEGANIDTNPAQAGASAQCFPRYSQTGFQWDDPTAIVWSDRFYQELRNISNDPTTLYHSYDNDQGADNEAGFYNKTASYVANLEVPGHPWCPLRHNIWHADNTYSPNASVPIAPLAEQGHINVDFSRSANPARVSRLRDEDLTEEYAVVDDASVPSGTWNYVLHKHATPVAYHTGYASGVQLVVEGGAEFDNDFETGVRVGNTALSLPTALSAVTDDDFKLFGDGFNTTGAATIRLTSLPAGNYTVVLYAFALPDLETAVTASTITANGVMFNETADFAVYRAETAEVDATGELAVELGRLTRVVGMRVVREDYEPMTELPSEGVFHYKCPSGALTDPTNRERLRRAIRFAQNSTEFADYKGWARVWDRALMVNMSMFVEIDDSHWSDAAADNYVIVRQTIRMELPVERHHWGFHDAFGIPFGNRGINGSESERIAREFGDPMWADDGDRLGQLLISHMDLDLGVESSSNLACFNSNRQANRIYTADDDICPMSVSQAATQCDEYGELLYDVGDYRELNHPWLGERIDWVDGNEAVGYGRGAEVGADGRFIARPEAWQEFAENFNGSATALLNGSLVDPALYNVSSLAYPFGAEFNGTFHTGEGAELTPRGLIDRRFLPRLALDGRGAACVGTPGSGAPLTGDVATNMAVYFGARDYSSSSVPDHFPGDHAANIGWPNGPFFDAYYHQAGTGSGTGHFHDALTDQRSRTVTFEFLFRRGAATAELDTDVAFNGKCPNVGHRFYNRFPWATGAEEASDGGKFFNRYPDNPAAGEGIGFPWRSIAAQPAVREGGYAQRFDVAAPVGNITHTWDGVATEFASTLPLTADGLAAGSAVWITYQTCAPNTKVRVVFDIESTRYDRLFVYECCAERSTIDPTRCVTPAVCATNMSTGTGELTTPAPDVTRQSAFVHPINGTHHRRFIELLAGDEPFINDVGRQQRHRDFVDTNSDADFPYYPAWYYDEADATYAISPTFNSFNGSVHPLDIVTPASGQSVLLKLGVDSLADPVARPYRISLEVVEGSVVADGGDCGAAPPSPSGGCNFPGCPTDEAAIAAAAAQCSTLDSLGSCDASLVIDELSVETIALNRMECSLFTVEAVRVFWDCVDSRFNIDYGTGLEATSTVDVVVRCDSGNPSSTNVTFDGLTFGEPLLPAAVTEFSGVLEPTDYRSIRFRVNASDTPSRKRGGVFGGGPGGAVEQLSVEGCLQYDFFDACGAPEPVDAERAAVCAANEETANFGDFAITWAQVANLTIRYTIRYLDRPSAPNCAASLVDATVEEFNTTAGDSCASLNDTQLEAFCVETECPDVFDEAVYAAVRVRLNQRGGDGIPAFRGFYARIAEDGSFEPVAEMNQWRLSDIAFDAATGTAAAASFQTAHPALSESVYDIDALTGGSTPFWNNQNNAAQRYTALEFVQGQLVATWSNYSTESFNESTVNTTFFGIIDRATGDPIVEVPVTDFDATATSVTGIAYVPDATLSTTGRLYFATREGIISVLPEAGRLVAQMLEFMNVTDMPAFATIDCGMITTLAGNTVSSLTVGVDDSLWVGTRNVADANGANVLRSATSVVPGAAAPLCPAPGNYAEIVSAATISNAIDELYISFNRSYEIMGLLTVGDFACTTNDEVALAVDACDESGDSPVCPAAACPRRCARALGECVDRYAGDGDGFILDFGGDAEGANTSFIERLRDAYTGQPPLPPGYTPFSAPHGSTTQERPQSASRLTWSEGRYGPETGLTIPQDLNLVSTGIDRDGEQYYVYEGIFDAHYNQSMDVTVSWTLAENSDADNIDNIGFPDNATNYRAPAARNVRCDDTATGQILAIPVLEQFVPIDVHGEDHWTFTSPAGHMSSTVPLPLIYQMRTGAARELDVAVVPASINGTRIAEVECRFGYPEAGIDVNFDREPLAPNNQLLFFSDDNGTPDAAETCALRWNLANVDLDAPLCPNGAKYQTPLYGEGGQTIALHDLTVELVDDLTAPIFSVAPLSREVNASTLPGADNTTLPNATATVSVDAVHFLTLQGEDVRAGEQFEITLFTGIAPNGSLNTAVPGADLLVTVHSRLGSIAGSNVVAYGDSVDLVVRTRERAHGSTVQVVWVQVTSLVNAESSWVAVVLLVRDALHHERIWQEMADEAQETRDAVWDHFDALGVQLNESNAEAKDAINDEFQELAEYIQERKDDVLDAIGAQTLQTQMAIWDHFEQLGIQLGAQADETIDDLNERFTDLINRVQTEGNETRQLIWMRLDAIVNATQGLQLGAELSFNATLGMQEGAQAMDTNRLWSDELGIQLDNISVGIQEILNGTDFSENVDDMVEHIEVELEELRDQLRTRDVAVKQCLDRIKSIVAINGINIERAGQDVRKLTHTSSAEDDDETYTSSSSSDDDDDSSSSSD